MSCEEEKRRSHEEREERREERAEREEERGGEIRVPVGRDLQFYIR